jgi:hypothetical protein
MQRDTEAAVATTLRVRRWTLCNAKKKITSRYKIEQANEEHKPANSMRHATLFRSRIYVTID